MLRLDPERLERGRGEVLEVEGHDGLRTDPDGGGEDVSVVGIGQLEAVDEALVTGDPRVRESSVHQRARTFECLRRELEALTQDGAERLVEDVVAPVRLNHGQAASRTEPP